MCPIVSYISTNMYEYKYNHWLRLFSELENAYMIIFFLNISISYTIIRYYILHTYAFTNIHDTYTSCSTENGVK